MTTKDDKAVAAGRSSPHKPVGFKVAQDDLDRVDQLLHARRREAAMRDDDSWPTKQDVLLEVVRAGLDALCPTPPS